jgi:hypothetical protein
MGDIVPFSKPKPLLKNSLCRNGFHKWKVMKENRFDVKLGKLVTAYRCERCGALKNEAR